jgi:galactose-1-phosphate uridylyltransferase
MTSVNKGYYAEDPLTGRVVFINEARRHRDRDNGECRFCPGRELTQAPELLRYSSQFIYYMPASKNSSDWTIRGFPNLYKRSIPLSEIGAGWMNEYLSEHEGRAHIDSLKADMGQRHNLDVGDEYFFDISHMVIVSTPDHSETLSTVTAEHFNLELLTALGLRQMAYKDGFQFSLIYKNFGKNAGQSQEHAHSQILSYHDMSGIPNIDKQYERFKHDPDLLLRVADDAIKKRWMIAESGSMAAFAVPWEQFSGIWVVNLNKGCRFIYEEPTMFGNFMHATLQKLISTGYTDFNYAFFDSIKDIAMQPHAKIVLRNKIRAANDIFTGEENHSLSPETLAVELG